MNLYLIQHGKAEEKQQNPERPLTADGKADADAVALVLGRAGVQVSEIWHSGKTRARQTAERFLPHIAPVGVMAEVSGLSPDDPVRPISAQLEKRDKDLAIVGHQPFLSRLASWLLVKDEDLDIVAFQRAGVVALERSDDRRWQVVFMITPNLVGR